MNLNKKGFTLIELIIAISLISVVLLFLYSLISDISGEIYSNSFALENQITRFEIIEKVNSILEDKSISDVYYYSGDAGIIIEYVDGDDTKYLYLIKDTSDEGDTFSIGLDSPSTIEAKWTMDSSCYLGEGYYDDSAGLGYVVYFEVYTYNSNNDEENNNTLDDYVFYLTK